MNIKIFLFTLASIIPITASAFFCPNNFNQIDFGNSPEQVARQCGKPTKMETREVKNEGPQEWSYFIPQTVVAQSMMPVTGTLKTQIMFDGQGKAININVNGIGVGATSMCGSTIQLGDTRERIKTLCGDAPLVNKETSPANAPLPTKVVEYQYGNATLVFENGALTKKQ